MITPSDPFSWATEYLSVLPEKNETIPERASVVGSIIRERITAKDGRTLAVRWVSGIIGDMWVTLDRATALRCGIVRPGGPPVFYLATDDVEFFRDVTPGQLERLAEFKKAFLSPERQ